MVSQYARDVGSPYLTLLRSYQISAIIRRMQTLSRSVSESLSISEATFVFEIARVRHDEGLKEANPNHHGANN
jgi:hypothetical protein